MDGNLRPTLLGRLKRVDVKTETETQYFSEYKKINKSQLYRQIPVLYCVIYFNVPSFKRFRLLSNCR